MGKHAKPAGKRGGARPGSTVRARPLPIKSTVRLRRPVDIWHKPALSAVVALAIPDATLYALGRLDLVLYTSAGAMCALYAHGLPYAARARALPWVVLGMVASLGIALTAGSLVTSTALLVVLASLVAAAHKMICDATRIGPPGNLILTFIAASAFFVPQQLGQVPLHLGLALGTGALAWLVCMAPSLVRPQGPERIATARALEAAAGLLRTESAVAGAAAGGAAPGARGVAQARHGAAAAVNAAWHTLFLVPPARTPEKAAARAGLERLLVRAEAALGGAGTEEAAGGRVGTEPHVLAGVDLLSPHHRSDAASSLSQGYLGGDPFPSHDQPGAGPFPSRDHLGADPFAWHVRSGGGRLARGSRSAAGPFPPHVRPGEGRRVGGVEREVLVGPVVDREGEVERLHVWARDLRRGRPLPWVALSAAQAEELRGIEAVEESLEGRTARAAGRAEAHLAGRPGGRVAGRTAGRAEAHLAGRATATGGSELGGAGVAGLRRPVPGWPRGLRAVLARLAPGSPLLPIGARVAVGCALAGWASMAVGVGHPYWAVVTAASIYQANTTLSWQRALQRTLGNLLGLGLFTALLPLIHTGQLAMIALALAFQLGAEACITRNYWLGSVWVTPMALLLTEFGSHLPATTLIADRWIDTVVGAGVGLVCCIAVTNRRAADRIDVALERVARAEAAASRLLAAGPTDGVGGADGTGRTPTTQTPEGTAGTAGTAGADDAQEAGWARDRLVGALVELREAAEVAAGEWWQRALPEERIAHAEQQGHRALAGLVRRLSSPALAA
ncbi:FUSC family protein [Streptomyces lydicus]|uniref:FUSC family protein n=1 Tax=Streptomyces lydicus TaxID=47763 RepID=UPI0036E705C9